MVTHGHRQNDKLKMRNRVIVVSSIDPAEEGGWHESLTALLDDFTVLGHRDAATVDRDAVRYLVAWKPEVALLERFDRLRAIFSLGAGVDHILRYRDKIADIPVFRLIDPDMTARMVEYCVLHVLHHHRHQRYYDALQQRGEWRSWPNQRPARDVRVGIMGMGVLGGAVAMALQGLGFQVAGWSRSGKAVTGVESFTGAGECQAFLARTDILVCLLPATAATAGILDRALFRGLARDGVFGAPVVINAGRGALQNEPDIVAALDAGELAGVTLDVFCTEPLPAASLLWDHPRVVITPHIASETCAEACAPGLAAAIRALECGEDPPGRVDLTRGY